MTINVVDQMMGTGKTSAAINFINEASPEHRFLYITPFLTEVDRIKESCAGKGFCSPEGDIKIRALKALLNQGRNIVTTHSLFHFFDDEIITLCRSQSYILIMDEVTDVIDTFEVSPDDRRMLFENYLEIGDGNILRWKESAIDYEGRFEDIKRMTGMECLACFGEEMMMWLFPVKIFSAFEESYILTYMFDGQLQKYYYDYFNLNYHYMYVDRSYHFTESESPGNSPENYRDLIDICNNISLNYIGQEKYSLGKAWYERNKDGILIDRLNKNIVNYFKNVTRTAARQNIWTTFNQYRGKLKGKGYSKGFVPCNARSTNLYGDRTAVAYTINRFMNPYIKKFFESSGIDVDEDKFALSEMVQFIWRSAIRNGRAISVYVPSFRMRMLLYDWLGLDKFNDLCYPDNEPISIHRSIKMKGDAINEG